jgi:lycopene cyclase domain-containing protein
MPVYLITYTLLFWLPAILFVIFLFGTLAAPTRKAFWAACAAMAAVSVAMEYLFLHFDVWFFSQKIDRLLGLWIGSAPVEEFVFWFGATPFCLAVYFTYCRLLKKNAR